MSPGIVTGSPDSIVVIDWNLGSMFSFCSIASEISYYITFLGQVANDDSFFILGLSLAYGKMNNI